MNLPTIEEAEALLLRDFALEWKAGQAALTVYRLAAVVGALRGTLTRMGTEEYHRTCVCHGHQAARDELAEAEAELQKAWEAVQGG